MGKETRMKLGDGGGLKMVLQKENPTEGIAPCGRREEEEEEAAKQIHSEFPYNIKTCARVTPPTVLPASDR